jgi:hypothetical protein
VLERLAAEPAWKQLAALVRGADALDRLVRHNRPFTWAWAEGGDCLAASKFLERALGVVASDRKTSEFYAAQVAEVRVEQ